MYLKQRLLSSVCLKIGDEATDAAFSRVMSPFTAEAKPASKSERPWLGQGLSDGRAVPGFRRDRNALFSGA